MSRLCAAGLVLGGLMTLAPQLWAEGRPEPARDSQTTSDAIDFVYLGPTRPLVFRLRITIDGRPFRDVWQARFDELFAEEDRERDGRVTLEQVDAIARDMNGSLAGAGKTSAKDSPLRPSAGFVGTVDRASSQAYVEKLLPSVTLAQRAVVDRMAAMALFPLLDTDNDHRLSSAELSVAEERVRQRDFDDNRVITRRELVLDPAAIAAAADPAAGDRALNLENSPIILLDASITPDQFAGKVLTYYDHNQDGHLATSPPDREIDLTAETLGRLDGNGDGKLEREELEKLIDARPDVELPLAMGRTSARDNRARAVLADREFRARKTLAGGFDLKLGEAEIKFLRNNRNPQEANIEFRRYDTDNNAYINKSEAGNGGIGEAAFAAMDTDEDGKVMKGEFGSFMNRQNAAAAVRLQLEVTDEGQSLFDLLDTDSNGVLSARELRTAVNILSFADKNGDGTLGGDEIPQHLRLELVRGVDQPGDARSIAVAASTSTAKSSSSGPLWFRKMDRNGDGDLSPHEFVGPIQAFRKLDVDGDGLIDRQEAEAASPKAARAE
jgi:Ca2+-binding EF-hand superfamily protein